MSEYVVWEIVQQMVKLIHTLSNRFKTGSKFVNMPRKSQQTNIAKHQGGSN